MRLVPFEPDHIHKFFNYGGQDHLVSAFSVQDLEDLRSKGEAFTAMKDDRVLGCGGLQRANNFRATAWGLFQRTTPTDFLFVHRAICNGIKTSHYKRIEAYVDPKMYPAMRWIEMLGFKLERPYIPFFFPDGSGASAWAIHK